MLYVYIFQNIINLKIYIGITNDLKYRYSQHITHSKKPHIYIPKNHYQYIHRALHKHGKENFSFQILETFATREEVLEAEKFWIEYFRSWDKNYGYNLTRGGEGISGYKHSEEHKKKISKSLLGNTNAVGTIHTEHWKQDMSIKHAGEKNAKAKITAQDVLDIRQFHLETKMDNIFEFLSQRYNLSISGLEKIIYRKTWKHI